ncbi:regulating synaptic membrane exocytosis protein 3-like [Limulus polyphemus]|uniref:Regulating synaptic membrane exocytosis protein 3-like n=1 Tax=Limulus polyphemus TaxID=6850 RepID=A0ABM1RUY8_LIMPO|nr:regulating synaptic membrane exocytosis protein 3-like [Limulus polyphemus]
MPALRLTRESEYSTFVEGLGPGQFVGRQALASPYLGDIQLSISDRKRKLEIEVIRARGLQPKPGAKSLPASYVKVYLVLGSKCLSKAKTSAARRTLDPLYQEQLHFDEDFRGCVLQVTIWGDYGRMEKKVFMGVAQIMLNDLDLSDIVIGWYKLFHPASLVNLPGNSQSSIDNFG